MHAKTTPDNYDKILADLPNELENNYKIYKTSLEKHNHSLLISRKWPITN